MSIKLVMPSNHLIFCHPLPLLPSIFTSIKVFLMSQFFASGGPSIGASASTSVLAVNLQRRAIRRWKEINVSTVGIGPAHSKFSMHVGHNYVTVIMLYEHLHLMGSLIGLDLHLPLLLFWICLLSFSFLYSSLLALPLFWWNKYIYGII